MRVRLRNTIRTFPHYRIGRPPKALARLLVDTRRGRKFVSVRGLVWATRVAPRFRPQLKKHRRPRRRFVCEKWRGQALVKIIRRLERLKQRKINA
jgi:hypothetical protein